jgi:hypothetical protein
MKANLWVFWGFFRGLEDGKSDVRINHGFTYVKYINLVKFMSYLDPIFKPIS